MLKAPDADKYIWAHSQWKQRLRSAITTGRSEFTVERVCTDNSCDLGKWIHGLPPQYKVAPEWQKLKTLHAQFHTEAGRILKLALEGNGADAEKALGLGSSYSKLSSNLVELLGQMKG
jgi:methyl-accepting chemotaxis protein